MRSQNVPKSDESKPDTCQKCGRICIEKDNRLRGPLEGSYEWLCGACYNIEATIKTVTWKNKTV